MAPRMSYGAVAVVALCITTSLILQTKALPGSVVTQFSCTPNSANTYSQDVYVTCSVRVINREEDIDYVSTQLTSPSGKTIIPIWLTGETRAFGNAGTSSGINFATSFTIPKGSEPGYWQFAYQGKYQFKVVTKSGATLKLTPQDADNLGLARFFKVYGNSDVAPPSIVDVDCTSPVQMNNTKGDIMPIQCDFTVQDLVSGVGKLHANFISPSGNNVLYFNLNQDDVISSSRENNTQVVRGSVFGYPGMEGGTYRMLITPPYAPYVEDRCGNGQGYDYYDTSVWTEPTITIISSPDIVGPYIQRFLCPTNQVALPYKGSDSITCQMVLQDDKSGFQYGELVFNTPDQDNKAVLRFDASSREVEFQRGGIYAPKLTWDWGSSQEGMYTADASGLVLKDNAGNVRQLTPRELNKAGFPTFFYVTKAKVFFQSSPEGTSDAPSSHYRTSSFTTMAVCIVTALLLARKNLTLRRP